MKKGESHLIPRRSQQMGTVFRGIIFILLSIIAYQGCARNNENGNDEGANSGGENSDDTSANPEGDADGDADGDGDGDADGDGDGDADGDGDGDAESDAVREPENDTNSAAEGDMDTEAEETDVIEEQYAPAPWSQSMLFNCNDSQLTLSEMETYSNGLTAGISDFFNTAWFEAKKWAQDCYRTCEPDAAIGRCYTANECPLENGGKASFSFDANTRWDEIIKHQVVVELPEGVAQWTKIAISDESINYNKMDETSRRWHFSVEVDGILAESYPMNASATGTTTYSADDTGSWSESIKWKASDCALAYTADNIDDTSAIAAKQLFAGDTLYSLTNCSDEYYVYVGNTCMGKTEGSSTWEITDDCAALTESQQCERQYINTDFSPQEPAADDLLWDNSFLFSCNAPGNFEEANAWRVNLGDEVGDTLFLEAWNAAMLWAEECYERCDPQSGEARCAVADTCQLENGGTVAFKYDNSSQPYASVDVQRMLSVNLPQGVANWTHLSVSQSVVQIDSPYEYESSFDVAVDGAFSKAYPSDFQASWTIFDGKDENNNSVSSVQWIAPECTASMVDGFPDGQTLTVGETTHQIVTCETISGDNDMDLCAFTDGECVGVMPALENWADTSYWHWYGDVQQLALTGTCG